MGEAFAEWGRTVRFALGSDERTARLVVLMSITLIGIIAYGIML